MLVGCDGIKCDVNTAARLAGVGFQQALRGIIAAPTTKLNVPARISMSCWRGTWGVAVSLVKYNINCKEKETKETRTTPLYY